MSRTSDYLLFLNDSQIEAVTNTEGPLLVLAGAGTGKTKVLTTRIAHIIESNLASPENILAVTFTNKAAKEMTHRVSAITTAMHLNIGTFHSIAARILRIHINLLNANFNRNFTIIDQDEQLKLIKDIVKNNGIDVQTYPPKALLSIISRWKDLSLSPAKLSSADMQAPISKIAANVYSNYQNALVNSNALDFGDLLLYNNELFFQNSELLRHYQNKFKYILIDEYQDTNAAQYIWVRLFADKWRNICCVGDDDQSIYSWRGAEIQNILRFSQDFPNPKIVKLEKNYRSTQNILSVASTIISNNKNRHAKVLWTEKQGGDKVKIISCSNDKDEAYFITKEIEKFTNKKLYNLNEIAILVRAGFQTRAFEEAFINSTLPYRIIGGLKFYERLEIKDVLSYIRVSVNNNDNLAFERIINKPKRGIGAASLKQIKDHARDNQISLYNSAKQLIAFGALKGKIGENLKVLLNSIANWQQLYINEPAYIVTKKLLDDSGYLEIYRQEKTTEALARIENINEMLRALSEFESVGAFLEHTSLVMENDSIIGDTHGAVSIMTLHAAKGLEFNAVFLPGWEEGVFPHQRSLNEGEKSLEEERRIAYVGVTRAKEILYITYASSRMIFNEIMRSLPSRFLNEINEENIEKSSSSFLASPQVFNHPHTSNYNNNKTVNNAFFINKTNLGDDDANIRLGTKAEHSKFGLGTVIRINEDNIDVAFSGGIIKTIKQNFLRFL